MGLIRLDKLLSNAGYGSRSEIKRILKEGVVTVDGTEAFRPEEKVDPEAQTVLFDGNPVYAGRTAYIMLHKPAGVISATFDEEEETVIDLLDEETEALDLFPVGRLDKDTTGLLLLTNDGAFAHRALSPKKHVPKTYIAALTEPPDAADVLAFQKGVTLEDGYACRPASLRLLPDGTVEITITEGKYHQVKRMCAARGKTVLSLKRVAFGGLALDPALAAGAYRALTPEELCSVFQKPHLPE